MAKKPQWGYRAVFNPGEKGKEFWFDSEKERDKSREKALRTAIGALKIYREV